MASVLCLRYTYARVYPLSEASVPWPIALSTTREDLPFPSSFMRGPSTAPSDTDNLFGRLDICSLFISSGISSLLEIP
ncbi:hypothetical protein VTO73DRAFT_5876 [Trametes versicolor]